MRRNVLGRYGFCWLNNLREIISIIWAFSALRKIMMTWRRKEIGRDIDLVKPG